MAYDFDVEYDYDPNFSQSDVDFGEIESPYAEERWDITDIISSLWKGTGQAAQRYGRGAGIETLEGMGTSIIESEFAKPDEGTYRGEDSYGKTILMETAASLPTTAGIVAGGAVGSLAGPVGTVAGVGAATAALGRGLYFENKDRYWEEHPDGNDEDAHNYALMHAAVEGATEAGGALLGFGAMTLGKAASKPLLLNAVEKGVLTTGELLDTIAVKSGAGNFMKRMFGATVPEGAEEVVASYVQDKIDKKYEMKTEEIDYFKTFMIGAAAGGIFSAAGAKISGDAQNKIRANINEGLASEDQDQRLHTVKQVYDNLKVISPEAAKSWDSYASTAALDGPLSLDGKIDPSLAWRKNVSDWQKSRRTDKEIEEITRDPAEILKGAGIPSGTAELPGSSNPYGTGIAPPEEAKIDKLIEKRPGPNYWKKQLALWKQKESTPEYMKPSSPYSMSVAMNEVEEDTNTVPPPPPPEVPKTKQELKEEAIVAKAQLKVLKQQEREATQLAKKEALKKKIAEAEAIVVNQVPVAPEVIEEAAAAAPTEEEIDKEDLTFSREDLQGVRILMPSGVVRDGKELHRQVDAYETHSTLEEEINLYEDILRCAKG